MGDVAAICYLTLNAPIYSNPTAHEGLLSVFDYCTFVYFGSNSLNQIYKQALVAPKSKTPGVDLDFSLHTVGRSAPRCQIGRDHRHLCLGMPSLSTIPLFLTFDSGIKPSEINASTPALAQLAFVWGASAERDRLAAYHRYAPEALISYYMPYSRAPAASKGFTLDWWQQHHPDWVLYTCDRKTVAFWNGETAPTGSVPLDFTNPDVVAWQVNNQTGYAASEGYSAMAYDNFGGGARQGANLGKACGVWLRNGTWSPRFNQSSSTFDPSQASASVFREASIQWIERTAALVKSTFPGMGVVPNLSIDKPDSGRTPSNWAYSQDAARVAAASTAVLSERGFTGWGDGPESEAELLNEFGWIEYLAARGKRYFSINEVRINPGDPVPLSMAEWVVGCFLIGQASDGGSALWVGGVQAYGRWFNTTPALEARIGSILPDEPKFLVLPHGILMRNYSNGVALLNPRDGPSPVTVTVGRRGWLNILGQADSSVTATGSVVLPPQSSRVLLYAPASDLF